jgi:ankyrin repeat protein
MTEQRRIPSADADELRMVIKGGDTARLTELLAAEPDLATCLVVEPDGPARSPLHLLADAPGGRSRSADTVRVLAAAGADLNALAVGMWHAETPLHWAASNDDVVLIDALLEAGADIEHPGSSIDGGPPIQSALGYGQWNAVRRLYECGATVSLAHYVVLGMIDKVADVLSGADLPPDDLSAALWNACRRGDAVIARLLVERGADAAWQAPWSGETPVDVARSAQQQHLLPWLGSVNRSR